MSHLDYMNKAPAVVARVHDDFGSCKSTASTVLRYRGCEGALARLTAGHSGLADLRRRARRRGRLCRAVAPLLCIATIWCRPALAAPAGDSGLCMAAIATVEASAHFPPQMLVAIGSVESGRPVGRSGAVVPWPWTVDVAGAGQMYDSAAEAIAAVRSAQGAGIQSIDVGCMQINLQQHPNAFASLDQAFDPTANVRYAAAFLNQLYAGSKSWATAVAAYHSSTPGIGAAYLTRIASAWPMSAVYGIVPQLASAASSGAPSPVSQAQLTTQAVDPYHVLTPAFRAQLVADADFKHRRDEALGLVAKTVSPLAGGSGFVARRLPPRGRLIVASLRR